MTTLEMTRSDVQPMLTIDHIKRRYSLLLLFALAAFWGIAQVVSFDNIILHFLTSTLISATATAWIVADSRIRGHTIVHIVQGIVYCTWPVSSFFYLAGSRGWRGAGLWLLTAFGLSLAFILGLVPTMVVFEVFGWITADDLP